MKVKELIEILEQCNKELDVYAVGEDYDMLTESFEVIDIAQITMTKENDCVVIMHE